MEQSSSGVSASAMHTAREVRVVFGRLLRRLRESYDPNELTPSQMSVLKLLDKDGEASVGDLAKAERVRHQSMATTVGGLTHRGLVVRRADPDDGRRQLVSVSEAGRKLFDDRRQAGEQWLTRVIEDQLTEAERQQLVAAMALLERIARS